MSRLASLLYAYTFLSSNIDSPRFNSVKITTDPTWKRKKCKSCDSIGWQCIKNHNSKACKNYTPKK